MGKSADAFRTISEVADWLEVPAHVLRFWESKFTQVKPVKRAGGRRYYRPADMRLLGGIKVLLHDEGMTIKGVQKMLRDQGVSHVTALSPAFEDEAAAPEPGGRVLSFARPETRPPDSDGAGMSPQDSPPPDAAAEPETDPPDTRPETPPETRPEAGAEAGPAPHGPPAPQAPAPPPLPDLPDLPADPPDDMAAAPGPLARLATLPRPLPEGLGPALSALAERLRASGASTP
ncbi:MerR family transcriptional regulator [Roseovarius ramblicola]|uniref:MerR family transcriptional regulator n=1 Tax=Roseovarius ramblicola TaxID=2022336 RepID=A0ABV5I177_9RHOB